MRAMMILGGLGLAVALLGGCAKTCPVSCSGKPYSKCQEFYRMPDPCKGGSCTQEQRKAYWKLGNECAKEHGMVPLSPKYKLPAVDCPVEYSIDTEANCPPPCVADAGYQDGLAAQAGFLVTAFDTTSGTVFVMVDAEKDYDPKTSLAEAGTGIEGIARRLSGTSGAVAVYLTEYPLIAADEGLTSRQPRESELDLIKQGVQNLGRTLNEIRFVRWK